MSEAPVRVVNSFDQIKGGEFKRTPTDFHQKIAPDTKYTPDANLMCYTFHMLALGPIELF